MFIIKIFCLILVVPIQLPGVFKDPNLEKAVSERYLKEFHVLDHNITEIQLFGNILSMELRN